MKHIHHPMAKICVKHMPASQFDTLLVAAIENAESFGAARSAGATVVFIKKHNN